MLMEVRYIPSLVILSVLVAILASYVALIFAHSVTQARGRAQAVWLACGSLAMGVGIWSMHFVGMLAFEMPGMEMAYDVPLMLLSVAVAIGASALALFVVSRPVVQTTSVFSGGIAMAVAIAGMHYIGMFSMRMNARIEWDVWLVALSVFIALVASFGALTIAIRLRDKPDRQSLLILASAVMGFAIVGMHYTGMFAATFVHDDAATIESSNLLVTSGLSIAVVSTTLLILGLALAGSVGQRVMAAISKRAQNRVMSSEEKFRALVEAVEDYAIFMLDPQGRITTWNAGAEKITGYTDDEIIGRHVSILYASESRVDSAGDELTLANVHGRYKGESIRLRKDGTKFWANITIHPLRDDEGRLTGFSKVTRDVTQLKEAEASLRSTNELLEKRVEERTLEIREREAQLRSVTNALPILVAEVDVNEKILFANDSFCDWFEVDPARASGLSLEQAIGPERYAGTKPHLEQAKKGDRVSFERDSRSAGRHTVYQVTLVPEFDDHRRFKGVIIVGTDVTNYKEIEAELKAAKDAAEVANETKSAFLANMSHEIRTPLGAVLGFSELLLTPDLSPAERASGVEIIKRNGRLLSNIINDILDLSKVEAGKLEIEKVDVSFGEILTEIGSLLNLDANEKGVRLTVTSEGPVPAMISTDPLRLRQILLNIVGNAIKFTRKGSVDVRVKMHFANGLNKLAFYVRDTGEGISAEQARKIFSPFTQADASTTRRFGGTGLGLALSKKLAHALGGDVVLLDSSPGRGSTFLITIDPGTSEEVLFKSYDPESVSKVSSIFQRSDEKHDLKNIRILLVDDSPDNQALIKKLLRMANADVETASNGREGFEKALAGDFTLVLMDLQMPEMDGYEATRELRRRGYAKPIIALTAHAMKEERKKCLENGFDDHLTKPIDRRALIEVLSHYSA